MLRSGGRDLKGWEVTLQIKEARKQDVAEGLFPALTLTGDLHRGRAECFLRSIVSLP